MRLARSICEKVGLAPAETRLAETFEAARAGLPGDAAAREEAFRLFAERGLPHRRVEDFKYTDLRAAVREAAPFADRPSALLLPYGSRPQPRAY